MNSNNDSPRPADRQDVIELGVASVETKGGIGDDEFMGVLAWPGISDE